MSSWSCTSARARDCNFEFNFGSQLNTNVQTLRKLSTVQPKAGKAKAQAHRTKLLHPNSRKAKKVTGGAVRKDRIEKVHQKTSLKIGILVDKLQWFHDHMDQGKMEYTIEELSQLVEAYLHRFDEELEQIDIIHTMKGRKGRQHAAREDVIHGTMKTERNLFNTGGIDAPDLVDRKTLDLFREWDGTSKHASLIKMRKVVPMAIGNQKESVDHKKEET